MTERLRRFHNDGQLCAQPDCAQDHEEDRMCVCNCAAFVHHHSWFSGGSDPMIEECEAFGFNEHGGMKLVKSVWVNHCQWFIEAG